MKIYIREILDYLTTLNFNIQFVGDDAGEINNFCSLDSPKDNSITWVKKAEENSLDAFCNYSNCVVVSKEIINNSIDNVSFILTDEPKGVFFSILKEYWGKNSLSGIGSSSIIRSNQIDKTVAIGEHCFVGESVSIGKNTIIEHNVSIFNKVDIGDNCIIHSGTVIGTDGFGYFLDDDGCPQKVEHFGGVKIGNGVEIGANACIDRGTISDTIIGDNSKIDNLVHIAHNVNIGDSVMVIAGSVICGSVNLEDGAYIAPGGIIKNQLSVGAGSFVGLGAVVTKSVEGNKVVAGVPAREMREVKKGDK